MHRPLRAILAGLLPLLLVACGVLPPPTPGAVTGATPDPTPSAGDGSAGPRPIVVTTDMGMDDLLAIYVLLRDPAVDVRAITVDGTGLVHCGPGLRNLRRILTAFGRPEIPFACGRDDAGPDGTPFPDEWRATSDDMYGVVLPPVVGTAFPPAGEDLLADAIEATPTPVTIVALGPWTTLQDLFVEHPAAVERVSGIHAMAGAIDVPGNMETGGVTAADGIEWNVGADPDSVASVLALDIPVTLVPLDATNDVPVPADIERMLDEDHAAAGADIALETYAVNPYLASVGNFWWDATAAVALSEPGLLRWADSPVSISDRGRISRDPAGRPVRFATGADTGRTQAAILAGLRRGAARPVPFTVAGTLAITWDGTTCRREGQAPTTAGRTRVELHNRSDAAAGLLAAGAKPPRTWADALEWLDGADLSAPDLAVPDWIVQVSGDGVYADGGGDASALVDLPAGTVGVLCATGAWPDLTFVDGGTVTLQP